MGRISFDDVLGTNYVPSPIERCSIKASIESMEQELSSLNHILSPLLAKRQKLTSSIRAYTALLAPVRRVPPELISEVFIRTIDNAIIPDRLRWGESSHEGFPSPRVNGEPLKLGRICRLWRDIALSTPSLWSGIRIPTAWNIEGLREWISRSGSCTLCFTIQIRHENSDHLTLLASYQSRWKEVVFLFPPHRVDSQVQFAQEFLVSLAHNYENLRTLKFEASGLAQNNIHMDFNSAPNLRNLLLYAPVFDITTLDETQALCLRKINIQCAIPTGAFMSLLRQSPQVESVYARISFSVAAGNEHEMLTLLFLRRLEVRGEYRQGRGVCPLGLLHLPALEELSLHISYDLAWGAHACTFTPQVRSMIHRSRPPLKALRVCGDYGIRSADIMDCLSFVPNLSVLNLGVVKGGLEGIIELLTGQIPLPGSMLSGCLCPQLDRLFLGGGNRLVKPESIARLILSRCVAGRSTLSHVSVLPCTDHEVLADPRIAKCIANGLKFNYTKESECWVDYYG